MTATEVILSLQKSGELQKLCRTVAPPRYSDDLTQEVLLALLEKPASKIVEMHTNGYLKWYVVRMACNMYNSKHSGFHKLYRQFDITENEIELIEAIDTVYCEDSDQTEQQRIDRCNAAYTRLSDGAKYPYEQKLLDLYLQVKNVSKMSRETGIPRRTLIVQIKAIVQRIKDETDGITND